MADINNKFKKAGNIMKGAATLGGTLIGSYLGAPKADKATRYKKQASMVGNWNFGASDPAGLMSQYNSIPTLSRVTARDLYDPSFQETFGGIFGSGLAAMGATKGLTSGLKGIIKPEQSPLLPQSQLPTVSEAIHSSDSREDQFSEAEMAASNPLEAGIYKSLQPVATENKAPEIAPFNTNGWSITDSDPTFEGTYIPPHNGAPMGFAYGGRKYDLGGNMSMDWGNAIGTGVDLLGGMAGILSQYAGIKNQQERAKMEATEANASNLYAQQLLQHNFNQAANDTKNNMFNQQAIQMKAMGGDLQTHGADFPLFGEFNIIGAGGTHEENPFGGVFQGVSQDGRPNLVEEDEVVWNDYVFSNRIKVPNKFIEEYKLSGPLTYSEAAQKLSKEAEERPNDPISQNGLADALGALMQSQEEVRMKQEAARIKRQLAKMTPEEAMQLMSALNGEQQPYAYGGWLSNYPYTFEKGGDKSGDKNAENRGLFESGINNMPLEWLKYIASKIEGYDQSKYNYTGADRDIRKFIIDNYDAIGGWEGLNSAFYEGTKMPLLLEDPAYKYTTTEGYSMTPEQWNTFFKGMDAYQKSLKRANTEGKYYADPNFTYNGRRVGKNLPKEQDVEQDPKYIAFKKYVRDQALKYQNGEAADENVLKYIQALDRNINTEKGARKLLQYNTDGTVATDSDGRMLFNEGWTNDYDLRNYDQVGGIYHYYNDVPEVTKTKKGERHIVRLNGQEVAVTPEEMSKLTRFAHGDNYISQVAGKDAEGNDVLTHYYDYTSPTFEAEYTPEGIVEKKPPLQTWPRYAPVAGSAIGAILASAPPKDYSTGVTPYNPHYAPIGDYLPYMPVDTQRYINAENQQAAAQLGAIMNASSANKNAALANAAYANQQRTAGIGERMRAAEQINWDRLNTAMGFNRGTNEFNANAHNAAEAARMHTNSFLLNQAQTNAANRMLVDNARDAAISESLTTLFDNIGDIGRENLAWNQVNSNEALRYTADPNWFAAGESDYKVPTLRGPITATLGTTPNTGARGGYLLTKSKKNRR